VVLDISLSILTPDDWVVAFRFEELYDMLSPCFNRVKPFLAEHTHHVSLDSNDGSRSKVVSKNAKCCDRLQQCQGFKWLWVVGHLLDGTRRRCAESAQGR